MAPDTMPWQTDKDGNKDFKYQYHPGGDTNKPLKEAPSALNVVIVPNVTLPKAGFIERSITALMDIAFARQVQQMGEGWILGD